MSLSLKTAPTSYPVSIDEVAEHLRLSETEMEARLSDLNRLIMDATAFAEDFIWRAIITQTWNYYLDVWPSDRFIVLPKPPLQSVTGVYYTVDGAAEVEGVPVETEFEDYKVDEVREPARIVLERNCSWPTDLLYPAKPIRIEYVAGYGAASYVPPRIKQAMLLHIQQNHSGGDNTDAITNILRNYRITNSQYDA